MRKDVDIIMLTYGGNVAKARKTWREKLEAKGVPKVVDDPEGRGKMLVPSPLDIDALVRKVKEGKLITDKQIREHLANKFKVDLTCPMTTGIFLRILAEAAEEGLRAGAQHVTPYWRVVKPDGGLMGKFPGGVEAQAARLRAEGHVLEPDKDRGRLQVKDLESSLQRF